MRGSPVPISLPLPLVAPNITSPSVADRINIGRLVGSNDKCLVAAWSAYDSYLGLGDGIFLRIKPPLPTQVEHRRARRIRKVVGATEELFQLLKRS